MSLGSKEFGFWRSLGSLSIGQVVMAWDFATALALSVVGSILMAHHVPDPSKHADLAGDLLFVSAALFGVILAGFAILAALLGDRYSRLLEASGGSALQMLRHFLVVAGLLVLSIVLSLTFKVGGPAVYRWKGSAEQWSLGFTLFVFLWSLFSMLELMKLILGVAVTSTAFRNLSGAADEPVRHERGRGAGG